MIFQSIFLDTIMNLNSKEMCVYKMYWQRRLFPNTHTPLYGINHLRNLLIYDLSLMMKTKSIPYGQKVKPDQVLTPFK